jgi:hypothetical protein
MTYPLILMGFSHSGQTVHILIEGNCVGASIDHFPANAILSQCRFHAIQQASRRGKPTPEVEPAQKNRNFDRFSSFWACACPCEVPVRAF